MNEIINNLIINILFDLVIILVGLYALYSTIILNKQFELYNKTNYLYLNKWGWVFIELAVVLIGVDLLINKQFGLMTFIVALLFSFGMLLLSIRGIITQEFYIRTKGGPGIYLSGISAIVISTLFSIIIILFILVDIVVILGKLNIRL